MSSNLGRWASWYAGLEEPAPYGNTESYRILADWVADCDVVHDWGCGKGWMRNFIDADRYIGIDGTASPFADLVVDLTDKPRFREIADGIVMRHVIEHDLAWNKILHHLSTAFIRRCAIAVFTPMSDGPTRQIAFEPLIGVPDISFNPGDITRFFEGCTIQIRHIESNTQYGEETIFLIERDA